MKYEPLPPKLYTNDVGTKAWHPRMQHNKGPYTEILGVFFNPATILGFEYWGAAPNGNSKVLYRTKLLATLRSKRAARQKNKNTWKEA